MNWKTEKLVRLLLDHQPATAQVLAERMQVSVRSIKNYVREINNELKGTVQSSRDGYHIDLNNVKKLLKEQTDNVPQSSKERVIYILNQLLNHHNNEPVNVYDLCEQMYISMSTLKNELQKVKRKLARYDLELVTHGDLVTISGIEKSKRKMLSSILYDESNINFVNLQSLQNAFIDIDINFIKKTVLKIFDEYHYFINDYSLINLVLHITIAIDRIRNQNMNTQKISELPAVKLHEYALAQKVARQLEQHYHIQYSDAEIYEMTLLIISRATTIDYKSINAANLEQFIGSDCLALVNQLIKDVSAFYYIDLSEQEFLIRFALHIRNLLVRSKNDYFSKNPLTQGIKTSCPMIYDISVSLAGTIKEKTGVSINDDEIAYIAFHLGSTIEAQKNLTTKITAVLYCPSYYDMNLRITDTLNRHFSQELLITNILTDEGEFSKVKGTDLIITTIPLSAIYTAPTLQIHPFLTDNDRAQLKEKISEVRKEKKKNEFENYLRELVIPDFFEKKNTLHNQKSCITYMVNKMVKHGYVDASYKQDIFEREKMSSTAYGCFAIPHAMKMHAHKTGINIIASDKEIEWNGKGVHLVLMMCFNVNERYIFNEIFDPITMILSEPENVKKIIMASNYEDFIQNMISFI